MRGLLPLALAATLTGCVTAAGIAKGDQTTLPIFAGAVAGDLVVSGAIASQQDGFTATATVVTAIAFTALDVAVGCLLGSCASLRPDR
jgi:hypothetical protein